MALQQFISASCSSWSDCENCETCPRCRGYDVSVFVRKNERTLLSLKVFKSQQQAVSAGVFPLYFLSNFTFCCDSDVCACFHRFLSCQVHKKKTIWELPWICNLCTKRRSRSTQSGAESEERAFWWGSCRDFLNKTQTNPAAWLQCAMISQERKSCLTFTKPSLAGRQS